ncbi:unnamed protein product [Paramecium sonneborni]|uniref:Uncharacterized protein n=1 Tax=Paramecium sonneborni TaxID=65129 RepID=A0A8S1R896_9CILI|nr:unnamed protein product [Paramecium sonneborni]
MHKFLYSKLPQNYCRPLTSKANLPSYSFRYKLDLLGNIQIHRPCSTNNLCKIKLLEAQGIPSPKDKSTCFKREIIVAIYDNFYKQFVENSLVLKAKYIPENEDIWYFPVKNRNNGFYLNCENYKDKLNLILVFDFISYFKENNQVHKISSCFAEIPVAHIMRLGTFILPLKGGTIEQIVAITKEDIRCKRGGISGLITRITGDVEPQLKIVSMNKSNRPQLQKELQMLPPFCLCHRNMTQIIQTYRIFCEDKLKQDESVFIQSIDTFLFSLDCPYICSKMCKLWNRIIQGKMIGQEMASFQILIGQLQKLIRLKDFNFNPYSPSEVFTPEISKPKRNVVKSIFEYAEYLIDSSFFNKLGLDGDEILKEQMDLYGQPLIQGIYDGEHDPFDKYYNGLNLQAYETYVQQL